MSSSVSDANLEKKFQSVVNTQDSIQTLSLWLLHHKAHHQKIVSAWLKVLQKAKISHKLTLFYLANDVVQNGKRKGFLQFGNSFAEVLREATLLVKDEQIRTSIQRVFTIWEQRNVYSPEFIAELRTILTTIKAPPSAPVKLISEFKPEVAVDKLRSLLKLERDTSAKKSTVNVNKLNAPSAEVVQQFKDRSHGQQLKCDFDECSRRLESLMKAMTREIKERSELILILEQSEIFYDSQRGEAKGVANAYKNYGTRVKTLLKKLEELKPTFPSPLPSPCPDAPSPSTSDQELELNLPNDQMQTSELEDLENAPSPVGSPEGLNLTPDEQSKEFGKPAQPVTTTHSVGNPIPTLSNFFSNEQSGMTSWLDAFSNKKNSVTAVQAEVNDVQKPDPSSLDSRLSNLLQNIPNLPSGVQSSIFGNTSSENNTPSHDAVNSPVINRKDKLSDTVISGEATTPIKDEYSGQNTPLQDEDTHSSHSFFTKLASSNKTHSPKDILRGLTSLIQSASADKMEENQKKEKYSFGSSESYDENGGMSTFLKKIIPSVSQVSQHSSSSSVYFNSPQSTLSAPVRTTLCAQTTTVNSYQTVPFLDASTYSSKSTDRPEHLSYIPSLVPSTPHDAFNFASKAFPTDEYNPEVETFDTSMEVDNAIEDDEIPSPEIEPLSPVAVATVDEIPRSIGGRRLSTLITVVTKDSPDNSLPLGQSYLTEEGYSAGKENVIQEPSSWIDNSPTVPKVTSAVVQDSMENSPNEEFFVGKEAATAPSFYASIPPPVIDCVPANGQNLKFMDPSNSDPNCTLSRIETVQSHREDLNGRWLGNNWVQNEQRNFIPEPLPPPPPPPGPPLHCGMQEVRFFERKRLPPPDFHPRNNWPRRNRPENSFQHHHPYGPPPMNKRFPFRGRGWVRHQPRY